MSDYHNDHPTWQCQQFGCKPAATASGELCPVCRIAGCEGTHMSTRSAIVPPTWATPPASQPTVTALHGLVESLAFAYRCYLPHEDAPDFSSDTRTRIAFIEDILRKADALLRAAEQK